MDILYPGPNGNTRVPELGRNAGGRQFHTGAELNAALANIIANGGTLPLVSPNARFNDSFNSFDLRLSKEIHLTERFTLQALAEAFNLFNKANILGVNNADYSGFFNVLVRDSNDPADPGYMRSAAFGKPVTTAGGVFGSGGPRAFQLGAKLTF